MEKTTLSRQQLYDRVWSEPLTRLAKKYCISDNGLRKMCKSMNIPLPSNGYWMKIKYGKRINKPKLPKGNFGKEEVVLRPRTNNCNELSTAMSVQNLLVNEIMNDKNLVLDVPDRLSSRPDPLIISTKAYHDAIKSYYWRRVGRYPDRIDVLNIDVAEESLPRAYRLLDTLIKLLRRRNHEVRVDYYKTVAVIEGEEIAFRLREKNKVASETTNYGSRIMKPTGDFIFSIGEYSWREKYINDGKQRLESKLAVILAKLELEGKREHDERIESEKQQKIREEQEQIEREIKEIKEAELKKFTNLFKEALQLHHATILRNYIEQKYHDSDLGKDWIEWANEKVNWYDPMINKEDQLLDDIHKEIAFNIFMSLGK